MANTYSGGTLANVGTNAYYMTIDGVDSGLVTAAMDFESTIDTTASQFGQDATPRGERVSAQSVSMNFVLQEVTNVNFKRYLAGLAEISGSALYYGEKKGTALPTFQIKFYPLHADGHPWAGRVLTFYVATIKPNGSISIDPSTEDFDGFPITVTAFKDTSQSAGRELFSFDAAVTTVPTISSTSPADGDGSVAIAATVTVTFSIAMGLGTFTADTITWTTTGKTATAFDEVITPTSYTLDTAGVVLTLAHANLTASLTEYQITIGTGVKSASGVPIAAPYVFDFTTIA